MHSSWIESVSRGLQQSNMINKPILSFCYTNQPLKSYQDLDEVRSTSSYRTEVCTYRSATSSKTSVQRVNEIKPKPKIVVPLPKVKESKPPLKKMHTQAQEAEVAEKPLLTFDAEAFKERQKESKGLLDWAGMGLLCGMPTKKQSGEGCTCKPPCPYKKQWTKSHQNADVVAYLKLRGVKFSENNINQIDKDLHRTYTTSLTFNHNGIFREMLRQVLLTYSVYDLELGYVQGLNNIAAILLYHIKDAQKTFWALVELMEYQQLRMIYVGKLQYLQGHCQRIEQIIQSKLRDLHAHMLQIGIDIKIVLYGWLLSLMSKLIPLQEMHHVLNSFRKEGWTFIYKLILACLKTTNDCLLMTQDESEFIAALSEQSFEQLGLEWSSVMKEASKIVL